VSALGVFRTCALVLLASALFSALYASASNPEAPLSRASSRYVTYLERKLRNMFLTTSGRHIAGAQLTLAVLCVCAGVTLRTPYAFVALPLVALAPALYVERLRSVRLSAIEAKVDGFILALANALKTTPSIGSALANVQPLVGAPLDQELALALKEMRVGSTLDQALLNLASRVQSQQLDATLSGLLIGRQVGGDLSKILETTAATLREMARLQGVVRSKTAEGKAQLVVLAVFPAAILFMFDTVSHGYFDPLGESVAGWAVVAIAVVLWIASLLVARKVLTVNI